jgi:hypothetical protein
MSQLPEIAMIGLQEGIDTPSLLILAGLNENEYSSIIEEYFRKTLTELNIILPDKRQAALEYALAVTDEIIEGKKEIIKGTQEIISNAIYSYDFYSETKEFCYDSIGFEHIYELFDTYDELLNADRPWKRNKTNEELMNEVKEELLIELKKWKDRNKNSA